jgi:hypothetical protein
MYENSAPLAKMQGQVAEEVALPSISRRINDENITQAKLLYEIAEKLHNIKNNREPALGNAKNETSGDPSSFTESMHQEINRMQENSDAIRSILRHINQLV